MFTDIVGSTELVRSMGDEAWEAVLRWHDETLRTLIGTHRGEVVHTTGDGFFASFPTRWRPWRARWRSSGAWPSTDASTASSPRPDRAARGRGHRDRR